MKCPSCNKEVELTNKRYFKRWRTPFNCPFCSSAFKLKRNWKYYFWCMFMILITISGIILIELSFDDENIIEVSVPIWLITWTLIAWQIDRKIENTMPTVLNI